MRFSETPATTDIGDMKLLPVSLHVLQDARRVAPIALTLLTLLAFVVALASTYVGDASSPYDTCMTPNGRQVSCAVLESVSR
jgi:hypothetical protein